MWRAQENNINRGFPLTFDEIQTAWGYSKNSKSMATYFLPLLEEMGLVIAKHYGKRTQYLALPPKKEG